MMNESRRSKAHFDYILALLAFALAAFCVLAVSIATFSTSAETEDTMLNYIVASHYGLRQAIFFLISPIVIGFVTFFSARFYPQCARRCFICLRVFCCWSPWAGRAAGA